jgi:hypothetical protein
MNSVDFPLNSGSSLQWRPNSLGDFHSEIAAARPSAIPVHGAAGSRCFLVDSPPRFECAAPARKQTVRESAAFQSSSPDQAAWRNRPPKVSQPKETTLARSANEIARSQLLDCNGENSGAKAACVAFEPYSLAHSNEQGRTDGGQRDSRPNLFLSEIDSNGSSCLR